MKNQAGFLVWSPDLDSMAASQFPGKEGNREKKIQHRTLRRKGKKISKIPAALGRGNCLFFHFAGLGG